MGGPCGFRIPMTRPVCARGAPKRRPFLHGATPTCKQKKKVNLNTKWMREKQRWLEQDNGCSNEREVESALSGWDIRTLFLSAQHWHRAIASE